jgi:hypothetical protein
MQPVASKADMICRTAIAILSRSPNISACAWSSEAWSQRSAANRLEDRNMPSSSYWSGTALVTIGDFSLMWFSTGSGEYWFLSLIKDPL